MAFRDHFSGHAAAYAQARPSYPPALFAWLAEQCQEHRMAWDAGCGNGQASVAIAEYFDAVFATDPSAEQIRSASPHAKVRYAVEPGERTSLPDRSADLITVAQAYHWFDAQRFCDEAKRVARPRGLVAVFSYAASRVTPPVDAIFDDLLNVRLGPFWPPERAHVDARYRTLPFPFDEVAAPPFEMVCVWSVEQYLAYLRTWSAAERYRVSTGRDAVSEIEPALRVAWGDSARARDVRWPLTLRAGRT